MDKNQSVNEEKFEPYYELYDYMCSTEPYATEIKSESMISPLMRIAMRAYKEYAEKGNSVFPKSVSEIEKDEATFFRNMAVVIRKLSTSETE